MKTNPKKVVGWSPYGSTLISPENWATRYKKWLLGPPLVLRKFWEIDLGPSFNNPWRNWPNVDLRISVQFPLAPPVAGYFDLPVNAAIKYPQNGWNLLQNASWNSSTNLSPKFLLSLSPTCGTKKSCVVTAKPPPHTHCNALGLIWKWWEFPPRAGTRSPLKRGVRFLSENLLCSTAHADLASSSNVLVKMNAQMIKDA